jgi:hypothetical protein
MLASFDKRPNDDYYEPGAAMKSSRLHRNLIAIAAIVLAPTAFADAILDWNEVALAEVVAAGQAPPDGARTMAMVHVAMFDAVNAIEHKYTPYAFKSRAPADASPETAAAAAAHTVLAKLFPERQSQIATAYSAALSQVPDGTSKTAGIAIGEQVGAQCLTMRTNDGSGAPNTYRPVTAPGVYIATTLPVGGEWPNVTPWSMKDRVQFRPAPPPDLKSSLWARDFNEIKNLGARQGSTRTPEQTEAARFWTIVGPASWNPIVRALAVRRRASLADNARLFALANMAASDAFVAVFDAKYAYQFWRPVTAIRNGDMDGNDATDTDAKWMPLVDTPMHPEYPCAHCITASAVATVLEAEFGTKAFEPIEMTSTTAPGVTHRWTSAADYVTEVNNARIWGGLHYRNSTEVGASMGRKIGALAVKEILTPTAR